MKLVYSGFRSTSLARLIVASVAVSSIAACSWMADKGTIGSLGKVQEEETDLSFDNLDHQKVREEYLEIIELVDDKYLKAQIERRVADVYMMEGDHKQLQPKTPPSKSYYREAISSYVEVLEKYPNSPDNAEVLYQLAKAYDMEGEQGKALEMLTRLVDRHPYSPHLVEAYFRMGDIYFNNKMYRQAEDAYRSMIKLDVNSENANVHYMLGWSLYKQSAYVESLDSFAYVLNQTVKGIDNIDSLNNAEKSLLNDTLHSMSLALVYSGGSQEIENIGALKGKPYIWMVYQDLGDFFLEKELFEDSAITYRSFVVNHKKSDKAPGMHSKLIAAYIKGGFPHQALPEKERFIDYYGIHSKYKRNPEGGVLAELAPDLKSYIDELARHYHSEGQKHEKPLKGVDYKAYNRKQKKHFSAAVESYDKAARFYQEYVDTFPKDKRVAQMIFLKAETHFSARQYIAAISEYEKIAYELEGREKDKNAVNSGYAAIISYQKYIAGLKPDSRKAKSAQQKAVDSMLRFATVYHSDSRSSSVLTNTSEYLFKLDRYEQALQISSDLVKNNTKLDKSLKKVAYGIMAHSLFNLARYEEAEKQYMNQRALVSKKSKEYQQITERLAASIYKKSEILAAADKKPEAIEQLLKLKQLAPNTAIRITAQYDAATMLLGLEKWSPAIAELKALIRDFPENELAVEFPRKLAFAYEKSGNIRKAANSYYALYRNDPDAAVRQEALFLAADLYHKDKNYETAIKHYKAYAHQYEQPFDNRMEARFHLAELYEAIDDKTRHLYWLRRVIDGDKKGGDQRTDRSRWLGAWANVKYGDYFSWEFNRRKLRQPLEVSLPKKNKTLKDATTRYEMAVEYGIVEFVTMSSYKIAGLYDRFSQELIKSPRPQGLSAADKVMYEQIIDEQAAPFVALAADIHKSNIDKAWGGYFNEWINKSFVEMARLSPERFGKLEVEVSYGDEIR